MGNVTDANTSRAAHPGQNSEPIKIGNGSKPTMGAYDVEVTEGADSFVLLDYQKNRTNSLPAISTRLTEKNYDSTSTLLKNEKVPVGGESVDKMTEREVPDESKTVSVRGAPPE